MLKTMLNRSPFTGLPLRDVRPRRQDDYRGWQEQGFTSAVVDKDGIVVRLLDNDPNGVTAMVSADNMNYEAAMQLMIQGTLAEKVEALEDLLARRPELKREITDWLEKRDDQGCPTGGEATSD